MDELVISVFYDIDNFCKELKQDKHINVYSPYYVSLSSLTDLISVPIKIFY